MKTISARGHRSGLGAITRRIRFYTQKAAKYTREGAAGRYNRYSRLMAYKREMNRLIEEDFKKGGYGI